MIKLDGSVVVANTSVELDTLQSLLVTDFPGLLYSVAGNRDDNFPFKLVIDIDPNGPIPAMDVFFKFLLTKIDEVNQPV